ncbi:apolipoprotein N-acyltransferase [Thiobacter aerophilum]|uniref:Apolipoprotein N-acyltransferase n=1 Tax=Thiobacter aerophilum TaxID=3121275 RepID=A0ABV0EG31_9BURK
MSTAAIVHRAGRLRLVGLPFLLGAVTVLGFAPFHLFWLPVLTLAGLFHLYWGAGSRRAAALMGFAFGCGLFLLGVSWVYVSLHDFGGMPAPVAALATLAFCLFLALFPAAVGWFAGGRGRHWQAPVLTMPAAWALVEWVRGWVFTGFPWLAVGYAAVPHDGLAGYAPLLGVYGVSWLTALSAGLLALAWNGRARPKRAAMGLVVLTLLWLVGLAAARVAWTQPSGAPLTVSLLQGNVPQDLKWREERVAPTLETYARLVEQAQGRLVLLPETAFPLFFDELPPAYLDQLAKLVRARGGDLVFGVPERAVGGTRYYNAVVSFGASPMQVYRKVHLVPFGEFIPLRPVFGWLLDLMHIPLGDFARGAPNQRPLAVAGQSVAVSICYEDAFGEEIIRQVPAATLLANVSNDAWFGDSIAPHQHLQIAQMRALESGRMMLRATNTGITALIDPRGRVVAALAPFQTGLIEVSAQGHSGVTPYVRFGNVPVLLLLTLSLMGAVLRPGVKS